MLYYSCHIILYCTILFCTQLFYTILYYTILYYVLKFPGGATLTVDFAVTKNLRQQKQLNDLENGADLVLASIKGATSEPTDM